jgi:hypothetical protein
MRGDMRHVGPGFVKDPGRADEYVKIWTLRCLLGVAMVTLDMAVDASVESTPSLSLEDAMDGLKPAAKPGQRGAFLLLMATDLSGQSSLIEFLNFMYPFIDSGID